MNSKARVLILDDEPIVGARLKGPLERIGFSVQTCTSSAEAMRLLESSSFDILVTDLKMSGSDGLEVMRVAQKLHPKIRVIVITGFATHDTFAAAIKHGAVEFIAKPFKIKQLQNLMLMLVEGEKGDGRLK